MNYFIVFLVCFLGLMAESQGATLGDPRKTELIRILFEDPIVDQTRFDQAFGELIELNKDPYSTHYQLFMAHRDSEGLQEKFRNSVVEYIGRKRITVDRVAYISQRLANSGVIEGLAPIIEKLSDRHASYNSKDSLFQSALSLLKTVSSLPQKGGKEVALEFSKFYVNNLVQKYLELSQNINDTSSLANLLDLILTTERLRQQGFYEPSQASWSHRWGTSDGIRLIQLSRYEVIQEYFANPTFDVSSKVWALNYIDPLHSDPRFKLFLQNLADGKMTGNGHVADVNTEESVLVSGAKSLLFHVNKNRELNSWLATQTNEHHEDLIRLATCSKALSNL